MDDKKTSKRGSNVSLTRQNIKKGEINNKISVLIQVETKTSVKLGYNDHGYNELTAITNKIDW